MSASFFCNHTIPWSDFTKNGQNLFRVFFYFRDRSKTVQAWRYFKCIFNSRMCLTATEGRTDSESRGTGADSRQSNTSLVWVVVPLLSFVVTMTAAAVFVYWCCCWQRRRPLPCCDVMVRSDVTSSPANAHDLLHSLVSPPLRKRILFMRNNILYANGTAPPAKVCPAAPVEWLVISPAITYTLHVHNET